MSFLKIAALVVASFLALPSLVQAQVACQDVRYGASAYHARMDELARIARLPNQRWNRYHEAAVKNICEGRPLENRGLIDQGYVTASDVQGLMRNLDLFRANEPRSEIGQSYGYSRKKFGDMGLCSACADNVAQWYTRQPESRCGKLARQALEGNPQAERLLTSFPDYCIWKY
jgi:hypothetical protein